ncbi:AMP-binding protein [Thalassotalea fusca]
MQILNDIQKFAMHSPETIALRQWAATGDNTEYSYQQLACLIEQLAIRFNQQGWQQVGVVMNNNPLWVVVDLALMSAGITAVPIPLSFTAQQSRSLIHNCDILLCDDLGFELVANWENCPVKFQKLELDLSAVVPVETIDFNASNNDWICKIIHTSGTTDAPKGVKIRAHGLDALLSELQRHVSGTPWDHYLSLVPLSLLIEQVTAVYMTLSKGGTLSFLPEDEALLGISPQPAIHFWNWCRRVKPSVLTLPPGMVESLAKQCSACENLAANEKFKVLFHSSTVPFIACGGGAVSIDTLAYLREQGINVYEGYGLSENSSVVSWNSPKAFKAGTVGKPLAHVDVKLSENNELLIKSASLCAGYTQADPTACAISDDGWLSTGDLARIDDEGFLTILGRKKHVIITANGRNISPEWVERCYREIPLIENVVIFGEGLDKLFGVFFVPADASCCQKALEQTIHDFGIHRLSTLDRVDHILVCQLCDYVQQSYFTVTGRPKRNEIFQDIVKPIVVDVLASA